MSARLHALAAAIPLGSCVADVGTDHGRLLQILVQTRDVLRAIGIDRSPPALAAARRRAHDPRIILREGDGLHAIAPGEIDTVVLAGLGAASIIAILEAGRARWPELARLVLQPRAQWPLLRRWLADAPFALREESIVFEHGRAALVCVAVPSEIAPARWDDDDLFLGPLLRCAPTPTYARWLSLQLRATERALRGNAPGAAPSSLQAQHRRILAALAALPPELAAGHRPSRR